MVHLGHRAVRLQLEHGDRRALGEERELAAARLDLAARLLQLDQLALEALVEEAVVLAFP